MPDCVECGEDFPKKRKSLGYDTCLDCGAKEAARETHAKSKRIAIPYNKGPYMFIGDEKDILIVRMTGWLN